MDPESDVIAHNRECDRCGEDFVIYFDDDEDMYTTCYECLVVALRERDEALKELWGWTEAIRQSEILDDENECKTFNLLTRIAERYPFVKEADSEPAK